MSVHEINWQPDSAHLRNFGLISLVVAMLVAGLAFQQGGSGLGVLIAGVVMALTGLIRPLWLKPIYLGLTILTWPIGWCVSNVILVLIYFLVFTPLALVFRVVGRDTLGRRFDRARDTYWSPRPPAAGTRQYFRQS